MENQIAEAANQFQKACEKMGAEDMAIFYCYSVNKKSHTGGVYDSRLYAIGALEQLKFDFLLDSEQ